MNKTLLFTALLTLMSATTHADNTIQPSMPDNTNVPNPASAQPANPVAAVSSTSNTPQPAPVIDCKYHIPTETTSIEQSVISTWAGKAAVQSFEFNPATIDQELTELKFCYTDPGWQGFNDALQKSGNIDAIKSQHLTVSSQVDGEVTFISLKDNQWKVSVPLQVVYQNDKEKLTQLLSIDLLIGRKVSGDLGILQMIATPRQTVSPQEATPPTDTTNPPVTEQPTSTGDVPKTSAIEQPTSASPDIKTPATNLPH